MSNVGEPMYISTDTKLQDRSWGHCKPCTCNQDRSRVGVHIYRAELQDRTRGHISPCIKLSQDIADLK